MAIDVENLTVSYRSRPAIHHISCYFAQGSMWAICGPNGAGKSTLLKTVMRLLKQDSGTVHWQNLDRKDLAYLPQQADIDRSQPLSVLELTAMGLWYEIGCFGKVNAPQCERVLQALKRVNMAEWADRPIGHLSNGQFQRVLFARMLVQNARFLLLDEPFNAVDAKTTQALLQVLQEENSAGRGVIAVLHDYEQIRKFFPSTLLISKEKVAEGATNLVLTDSFLQQANALAYKADESQWCAM